MCRRHIQTWPAADDRQGVGEQWNDARQHGPQRRRQAANEAAKRVQDEHRRQTAEERGHRIHAR
jgi:hypothetical protein